MITCSKCEKDHDESRYFRRPNGERYKHCKACHSVLVARRAKERRRLDPAFRERQNAASKKSRVRHPRPPSPLSEEQRKSRIAAQMRRFKERYHNDPVFREQYRAYMRERYHNDPALRAKAIARSKAYKARKRAERQAHA